MLKESSNISQANSSHKRQKKLPLLTIKNQKKEILISLLKIDAFYN